MRMSTVIVYKFKIFLNFHKEIKIKAQLSFDLIEKFILYPEKPGCQGTSS